MFSVCGELSRHPDEKQEFQDKKREMAALETAAAKIELDLKGREAAFSQVNSSLSKHVEETLLEEFPHEYIQNNSKNWLKLQQDIAYVKKSLKSSSPPRREVVKSIISQRNHLEDEQHLGVSIPSHMSSQNPRKQPAKHKALTSFGITFPDRAGRLNRAERSLGFDNLLPTSREEEDELISMATRLSLTDDLPLAPNRMHATERCEEAKEAADILLSIQDRCQSNI